MDDLIGKRVKLLAPVRAGNGKEYFKEHPKIIRLSETLGRPMYLVKWDDDATTFVFPNELEVLEDE